MKTVHHKSIKRTPKQSAKTLASLEIAIAYYASSGVGAVPRWTEPMVADARAGRLGTDDVEPMQWAERLDTVSGINDAERRRRQRTMKRCA